MNLGRNIKNAFEVWQKHGLKGLQNRLHFKIISIKQRFAYQKWIREVDSLSGEDRRNLRREIEEFSHKPLISIILPVYNVKEKWLRLCIESVRNQIYENWQLCIADDCSTVPHIRSVLEK